MSATAVTIPVRSGQSWAQAVRLALIALAIVVLLGLSFVLGRTTASTSEVVPAIVPDTSVQTSPIDCRVGQPC